LNAAGDGTMTLSTFSSDLAPLHSVSLDQITMAAFATCNSVRIFAYIPQICKAATDQNGATAISYTTWTLFLVANLSTIAYALVNRSDWGLALCFTGNAICCVIILGVAAVRRRSYRQRLRAKCLPAGGSIH
jgi:hypothetical protein